MKRYWSRVCTMPARSCLIVLTTLRMSILGSPWRMPWMPTSMAIRQPVRPIPAEQWTTEGPALSAILTSLQRDKLSQLLPDTPNVTPLFSCFSPQKVGNLLGALGHSLVWPAGQSVVTHGAYLRVLHSQVPNVQGRGRVGLVGCLLHQRHLNVAVLLTALGRPVAGTLVLRKGQTGMTGN